MDGVKVAIAVVPARGNAARLAMDRSTFIEQEPISTRMSNTITIHGKQVQEDMIQMADACVKGAGDGRISLADAEKLFALVRDGNKYTDSEKDTMLYIRDKNYK